MIQWSHTFDLDLFYYHITIVIIRRHALYSQFILGTKTQPLKLNRKSITVLKKTKMQITALEHDYDHVDIFVSVKLKILVLAGFAVTWYSIPLFFVWFYSNILICNITVLWFQQN